MTPEAGTYAAPMLLVGLVVAVVGFLLRRAIAGIDGGMGRLAGKVDTLGERDAARDVMAAEERVRLANVERQVDALTRKSDDISGYLSREGTFRKRGSE